jgi:hypothetical protein
VVVPAERVFDGVAPPSPVTDDQRVVVRERVGLEVRHVVVLRDAPPLMVVRVGVVVGPSDGRVGPAGVSGVAVPRPVRGGGVGLIAADADRERERQEDGQSQASHPTHGAPDWREFKHFAVVS